MTASSRTWRTAFAAFTLVSLTVLTGCGASGASMQEKSMPSIPQDVAELSADSSSGGTESAATQSVQSEAAVIHTGYLSIRVEDPREAITETDDIVKQLGGRVQSRNVYANDASGVPNTADVVVRVPDTKLTDAYKQLVALGEVRFDQRSTVDVTLEKVDLEAQVKSLRTSVNRLESLITNAADLSDIIELENALSERQARLDSLTSQLDYLNDQVSFSTITIEFVSIQSTDDPEPQTFFSAFVAGMKSMFKAAEVMFIGFGYALPWLIVLAIITVAIILIVRLATRQKKHDLG